MENREMVEVQDEIAQFNFEDQVFFEGLKELQNGIDGMFGQTLSGDVKGIFANISKIIKQVQGGELPLEAAFGLLSCLSRVINDGKYEKAISDIVAGGRKIGQAFKA